MVAAAAAATDNPLTCSLFPSQATGVLQWTERQCTRKADALTVTATFELKPPPYPMDDLEPHMSKDTFEYHRGKHHRACVDNLNKQIDGAERDDMSLDDVVLVTYNKGGPLPAFNNAAQNRRPDYTSTSMEKLVSWDVVSARLEVAKARAAEREIEEARKRKEELYRRKKPA
ncbi:hypothetical protein POTOM_043382 [Populus tomentosa]|uniref:Manganese/iron superoxide dismutase N-terminal domain-containing protein n=1 Tax=Populus tomentosa TaxID=118781 RepID=A0A8X7YLY2_POPTO|nr:hypothetical protein POTOM_043382 [Populus tomentosa]